MTERPASSRLQVGIWLLIGTLMVGVVAATAGPLAVALRCYRQYADGERAEATVAGKAAAPILILRIASGPRAGESCTAKTNLAHHESVELDGPIRVVLVADRPSECVLEATLENSLSLLLAVGGVLAALLLGLVLAGLLIQRSSTGRRPPTTLLPLAGDGRRCPRCGVAMAEGYLVTLSGVHWREAGEPVGLPHAFGGLAGTVGWRERPRLHAFRCDACEVATFAYGRS